MNHKRGKPKSARAGCLLCKPHKHQAEKHSAKAKAKRWKEQALRDYTTVKPGDVDYVDYWE